MMIRMGELPFFALWLRENEKSPATIAKYMRDVRCFLRFAGGKPLEKALLVSYKDHLANRYAAASANSMIASLNALLRFKGMEELRVKPLRTQRKAFVPEEKELTRAEYLRLVDAARRRGSERLALLVQTICATGIRVSELKYITVDAVRRGEAAVCCKGKARSVFLVRSLRGLLQTYIRKRRLQTGPVFITRGGKPISRTAVWREMKSLCTAAHVAPGKVFPHNLRHLFARVFYAARHDLAYLADVLGHSSINTTRIYVATSGQQHRRWLESMELIPTQQKKPPDVGSFVLT